jgi:CRP-like cAMP-binding protein
VIEEALHGNYVFSSLPDEDLTTVVAKMHAEVVRAGENIITQGDRGDKFYVIESGTAEILVDGVHVGEYGPRSAFGELALLYRAPRAATIKAVSACTLWAVGLHTFRRIAIQGHAAQLNT